MRVAVACLLLVSCGGDRTSTPASAQPLSFVIEPGMRIADATSSCTLRLPDGTFRTWLPGIVTATSSDGLAWSTPVPIGIMPLPGEKQWNPAVLRHEDGSYLMIFESVVSGVRSLHRAESGDGVDFTRTGVVLGPAAGDRNFLSVPDLIRVDDGSLRMFFVAAGDHIESALSHDDGRTWSREGPTRIEGLSAGRMNVDPDIVRRDDGAFTLFFSAPPEGTTTLTSLRILSASSKDGVSFVRDPGERIPFEGPDHQRLDPDVIAIDEGYRMYFGESTGATTFQLRSALSP